MTDAADLFRRFDFQAAPAVVAAVSGGSDSSALLFLLKRHLDSLGLGDRLLAVTVDHGLRPGSDHEAAEAGRLAARLGVAHATVRWQGDKPKTGMAAAAREARYRLLAMAARKAGAPIVATGHTAEDQAETVAMRQARGDGRGLAAMAPATLFGGDVWIVRPLLAARRESLRDALRSAGLTWIDDPTNLDPAYERPRVRAALGRMAEGEFDRLLAVAASTAASRLALGKAAAEVLARCAREPAPGVIALDPDAAMSAGRAAALYALRLLLSGVGGKAELPDADSASSLLDRVVVGRMRATLARACVERRGADVLLWREGRGLPPVQQAFDGMLWDGRYRIRKLVSDAPDVTLRTDEAIDPPPSTGLPPSIARAAASRRPAFDGATHGWIARPVVAPWAGFLPSFDLAPARALAKLVGAEQPPDPPFAHHNVGSA